ncbi:MAG: AbrB/MazE/SpoVT family DNA-binding domain-containing protein [Nanoarchaeota archaeon]
MIEIKSKLRKMGNSYIIVVPLKAIKNTNLKEGDEIEVIINKNEKVNLRKMFGTLKFKKSTDQLMKEMDKELYGI